MKSFIFFVVLSMSFFVNAAQWSDSTGHKVGVFNPGALGITKKTTLIGLQGYVFPGCNRTDGAILDEANANYSELYSLFLAAKMSDKIVRVYFGECDGDFTKIITAYLL